MKKFLGLAAVIAALGLIVSMFGCSNAADGQGFSPIATLPPATYTITFNAHDGSETPATATQSFAYGTPQALKAIAELGFTKPGFKFAGWLAAADATESSYADGASYTATADATLYALWTLIPTELNTPLTLEAIEDGKFVFTNPWSTFKYKKNGGEFETVTTTNLGTNRDIAYIDVVAGDKVALYADGSENDSVAGKYFTIVSRKSCYVYGNVMSLESSTDFEKLTVVKESSAFANLFTDYHTPEFIGHQKNKIRSHAKITLQLPATTLAESCYDSMFYECEELERAPALPATTLTKSCYRNMFGECSALTSVPDVLPATTLVDSCYTKMFYGCVKLEKTPELPAQNLASKCYMQMFNGCEILENAPALPATTLASQCYTGMFMACFKLQNAPELPAKELKEGCYNSMFMACTSLNYIKCLAESGITTSNTSNWTKNAASDGNFIKANGANWPTGANGIPTNWTVQTPIPEYNIAVTGGKAKNASGAVITKATAGTVVKLEPNDAPMGQAFSYWQSSSAGVSFATSSKASNTTFTMPANDVSISANYSAVNYSINIGNMTGGTVTAKNSSGQAITSATYGQTVTLVIAADKYYDYTADSISVTGVSNLGGSGLTRSFSMPGQNVTVSATFFTGPTVAATEAKELGDIVLDNGLVVRYANRDKMTASQKSAAVAIIFDAANKKGVGVKIGEKKKWCSDGAGLYNTNEYTVSEEDGYANKTAAHPHMVTWSAGAYPAFWLAEVENRKGIYDDDKWYLPASKELITLFAKIETVNNSFDALGITTKIVEGDWTWSSSCYDPSKLHQDTQTSAIFVSNSAGSAGTDKKVELKACGVRVFN